MAEYRGIVAAVDINEPDRAVIRRAAALAGHSGARLLLVHVVEHFPEDLPVNAIPREDQDPRAALLEPTREVLRRLAGEEGCPEAEALSITSTRSARHELLEVARREAADLIVVGTHREGGLLSGLGSTAGSLVNHAPCDVLVVRTPG